MMAEPTGDKVDIVEDLIESTSIHETERTSIHELEKTLLGTTFESLFYSANIAKRALIDDHHDPCDFKTKYVNTEETTVQQLTESEEGNILKHKVVNQYFIEDKSNVFSFNPHWATDAQCHVWFHNGHAYLMFRGSVTHPIDFTLDEPVLPVEILENDPQAQEPSSESGSIRVHGTIYKQFMSLAKYISAVLLAHHTEFSGITCIGHSLGGSIASIAGVFYAKLYPDLPVIVHTFGATRVGNAAFAQYYAACGNLTTCRVYMEGDVSPSYPPAAIYVHPESEAVCLNDDGTFVGNYGDHNKRLNIVTTLFFAATSACSLDDYLERIRVLIYKPNSEIDGVPVTRK